MSFYEPDWTARPPEKKRSIWAIMGGWLKEESFYRDIATRALSIAVVAAVAYVYAVVTGHIGPPPKRVIVFFAGASVASVVYFLSIRMTRAGRWQRGLLLALLGGLVVLGTLKAGGLTGEDEPSQWDKLTFVFSVGVTTWLIALMAKAVRGDFGRRDQHDEGSRE